MATPITGSTWRRHEMQGGQISVLGQKQTFAAQKAMSALLLKAEIGAAFENVRFSNRPFWVKRFQTVHHFSGRCRSRARASLRNRH